MGIETNRYSRSNGCPVAAYDVSGVGYEDDVREWLANPHAFFKSFGPEAREFQRRHRSERLRTMTLVASAGELVGMRPKCICVDGSEESVNSWEQVFSIASSRLMVANPSAFEALQRDGLLEWMGCEVEGASVLKLLEENALRPGFESMEQVVARVQWLFLMCGIRLNEVIVLVDPYTDEEWHVRKADIDRRRAEDRTFLEGRLAAQRAWAEEHSEEEQIDRKKSIKGIW